MSRVYTRRVDTEVVDGFASDQRTNVKLVGYAVSEALPPAPINLPIEHPISAHAVYGAAPQPTPVSALDLRCESLALVTRLRALHTTHYTTKYTEYIGKRLLEAL